MASAKQTAKWENDSLKYNDKDPDYKELYVRYKTLAKQADQRLVRLESYQYDKHYKNILKYAYAHAMEDIKAYGGDKRFNTAPPTNTKQLQKKISDIENFLNMVTSTKAGIQKVYKKRTETLNKNFDADFTWEDLANYWEGVKDGKFVYDKQEFRAMIAVRNFGLKNPEQKKELLDAIKEKSFKNLKVSDDEVENAIAQQLLKEGMTPKKYFGAW